MENDGKQISAGTYLRRMGQIANKIRSDYHEFIKQHSDIPWHGISKMENGAVFDNDLYPRPHVIWEIIKKRLPEALSRLEKIPNEDLQHAVKIKVPDIPLWPGQLKPSQILDNNRDFIRDFVKKITWIILEFSGQLQKAKIHLTVTLIWWLTCLLM